MRPGLAGKMASPVKSGKRRHVMTEKMQAFVRAQSDAGPVRLLHCPHEGCGKVLTSSPGLRYHLKAHFQDRPFSCEKCNKTFKSSNGLKYHLSKTKCVTYPSSSLDWLPLPDDDPSMYPSYSSNDDEDDDAVMLGLADVVYDDMDVMDDGASTIIQQAMGRIGMAQTPDHNQDRLGIGDDDRGLKAKARNPQRPVLERSKSVDDGLGNRNSVSQWYGRVGGDGPMASSSSGSSNLRSQYGRSLTPTYEHDDRMNPSDDAHPGRFTTMQHCNSGLNQSARPNLLRQYSDISSANHSSSAGGAPSGPSGMMSPKTMSKLEELAIFATSSQSPLVRRTPPISSATITNETAVKSEPEDDASDEADDEVESSGVCAADVKVKLEESNSTTTSTTTTTGETGADSDSRVTSSSPYPASPRGHQSITAAGAGPGHVTSSGGTWSHSWPDTVWQCFTRGSKARFITGKNTDWQLVEDIAETEDLARKACLDQAEADKKSYAPNGLKLLHIEEVTSKEENQKSILRLRFVSTVAGQAEILVECVPDHPFFVRSKGWSSFHPSQTVKRYGIPCNELESGDICLPPDHPDATYSKDIFECFKNYKFTPMDSSAVFTLSNMAKQRRDQAHHAGYRAFLASRKHAKRLECKTKRPMNAFMLFAKQFRLQYTQAYPGKDNRAISILLGDQWKRLTPSQRQVFSRQAKKLADQQQKSHPDCWKRKAY